VEAPAASEQAGPSRGGTPTAPRASAATRHAMWRIVVAWMFGAAWMYTTMGAALTKYALAFGMPLFWFGVLAAVPYAGALAQLPTSFFLARYGHRKRVFTIAGMLYRGLWIPIALIPWVLPDAWWWPALLVIMAVSSFGSNVMSPAVLSWFADVIPSRVRGRFFARWRQGGTAVGLVATLLVPVLLDIAEPAGRLALMRTISIAFAAAAVLGMIDFLWLLPLPDVAHRPDRKITLWQLFRVPLADRNFRHVLGYTATLTLGMGFVGQFAWLYLFDVIGLSNKQANLLLLAVPMVVGLVVVGAWGRLVDRLGYKPTLVIAGALIVHGAAAWILVRPGSLWLGYALVLVAVAAWSGVELANFNILLGMSASRRGQRQGSAYLAVNSVAVAAAGVLSGFLGGAVASWLGKDWHATIFGWPLTYHGVLFLIAGAIRLSALFWLIGLEEPEAYTTRDAVRYVFTNIYSNLQQALFTPVRGLVRLGRLAFPIGRPSRREPAEEEEAED